MSPIISDRPSFTDEEALAFHAGAKPGKLEIRATKPMATQRDLSLAYSPGVAVPVRAIAANPDAAYDYTARRNLVAVISNGTAILGLGDLGALASKPVMEGKAVLFKRFADVDAIDLEVDTSDVEQFINAVRYLTPTFGGINLEDIKAPDCFIIEERLRELMDIPVFHDDQHGTAIITTAGLINALHLTGRNLKDVKVVVNGAGAAGIACLDLMVAMGLTREQRHALRHQGRDLSRPHRGHEPVEVGVCRPKRKARTLDDALEGADVFIGLSVKGAVTQDMVKRMAKKPIIFAMANPDPEITPEEARAVRPDAIIATGRSDYPNQINNVLGFPYIFRGALDVAARTINEEMKIAAAHALAELAREDVPDEVAAAYRGARPSYGPELHHPRAVRSAADLARVVGGGGGRDEERRRAPADQGHGCLSVPALRAARSFGGLVPEHHGERARQPEAHRVRRRRRGGRDPRGGFVPEFGPRPRHPGRTRRDRARAHPEARRRNRSAAESAGAALRRRSRALYRGALQAHAAQRRCCIATACAW